MPVLRHEHVGCGSQRAVAFGRRAREHAGVVGEHDQGQLPRTSQTNEALRLHSGVGVQRTAANHRLIGHQCHRIAV